jgi:4-hydroxybenzoate polyprenyl transferase
VLFKKEFVLMENSGCPNNSPPPRDHFKETWFLLRWDRPVGFILLYIPCLWGLITAFEGLPSLYLIALFAGGAFMMRSVGCIYNDWVDRNLDPYVERTRRRPLAQKTLSAFSAFVTALLLLICSWFLLVQLPEATIIAGIVAAIMILPYPWLKRVTYWPQLYLGIIFNSGVWLAWFARYPYLDQLTLSPFLLYSTGICWTLIYDTLYAFQDMEDDEKMGVKSLALRWRIRPLPFFIFCWGMVLGLLALLGVYLGFSISYYICLLVLGCRFIWEAIAFCRASPDSFARLFFNNQVTGWIITLSLWLGFLTRS